jgi:hypothetical protein
LKNTVSEAERVLTVEDGQFGGVGGDEAGSDAAPVAAADDGHPVLAVGETVLHLSAAGMQTNQAAAQPSNTDSKNKEAEKLAK